MSFRDSTWHSSHRLLQYPRLWYRCSRWVTILWETNGKDIQCMQRAKKIKVLLSLSIIAHMILWSLKLWEYILYMLFTIANINPGPPDLVETRRRDHSWIKPKTLGTVVFCNINIKDIFYWYHLVDLIYFIKLSSNQGIFKSIGKHIIARS